MSSKSKYTNLAHEAELLTVWYILHQSTHQSVFNRTLTFSFICKQYKLQQLNLAFKSKLLLYACSK